MTAKCKLCAEDINSSAKVCKTCGEDQRCLVRKLKYAAAIPIVIAACTYLYDEIKDWFSEDKLELITYSNLQEIALEWSGSQHVFLSHLRFNVEHLGLSMVTRFAEIINPNSMTVLRNTTNIGNEQKEIRLCHSISKTKNLMEKQETLNLQSAPMRLMIYSENHPNFLHIKNEYMLAGVELIQYPCTIEIHYNYKGMPLQKNETCIGVVGYVNEVRRGDSDEHEDPSPC